MSDVGTNLQALTMAVGEIRGQMRELVHASNNNAQALNGMSTSIAKLETTPERIAALEIRITALEAADHKRSGAMGLGAWLLKSPMVGWLIGAAFAVWSLLKGKL